MTQNQFGKINSAKDVLYCKPDTRFFNSCLGSDQLLLSAIKNETECGDANKIATTWCEVCNSITLSKEVGHAYSDLENRWDNVMRDQDHGSVKQHFPNKRIQDHFNLIGSNVSGRKLEVSEHEVQVESKVFELEEELVKNVKHMVVVDWRHSVMRGLIPSKNNSVTQKDYELIKNCLESDTGNIQYFHQLGFHQEYYKDLEKELAESGVSTTSDRLLELFRQIPKTAHLFAFQKSNQCRDFYTDAGRKDLVSSELTLLFESEITDSQDARDQIQQDDGCYIVEKVEGQSIDGQSKMIVTWISTEHLQNRLLSNPSISQQISRQNRKHHVEKFDATGEIKRELHLNMKSAVTAHEPVAFNLTSLEPYAVDVMSEHGIIGH